MKQKKKLVIVSNEKFSNIDNIFCCDNVDLKSIPEGLEKSMDVILIAKKSKIQRSLETKTTSIKVSPNLLIFLYNIFKTFGFKNTKYLLISITPYTFFSYIILYFFRKEIYVYLRSSGHEEYKAILGFIGPFIFHFMYKIVTFKSRIITCSQKLLKKNNYKMVFPSELDNSWFENTLKAELKKPKLLYVGRLRVEKGIFSLIKIFEKMDNNFELSIVGKNEKINLSNEKIKFINYENDKLSLIKIYDNHNILILPSFTEAHPKVVDESLSRERPVIIFKELEKKIQKRYGVFVSERNVESLKKTVEFIMKNYSEIQNDIKKNKLPTKQDFIDSMTSILN
tara:strand:- start:6999 stop:8015 length:1017 start_codon:yes stop_codon:yes gene_type:complete